MQDFHCPEPEKMHYKELAVRPNHFKNTQGGRKVIYRGIFPEAEEAAKKEVLAGLIERYYAKGFTKETIMDLLDLTDAQMDELS